MPVYEYRCDACNHQFELRQKFSDAPADSCPKCGGDVRKIVSAVAFTLKGGGWYAEGYDTKSEATPKSETDTAANTETAPGSATTEAATTDSTPKEPTASPAAAPAAPASSQHESKSTVAEKPAVTLEKAKSE